MVLVPLMKIYEIITETAWARRAAEIPTGREDEFDEPIYGDFDVGEYDTEEPLETELGDDAEGNGYIQRFFHPRHRYF